jgi:2-methylcitrate dehydratase PrpD
MGTIAEEYVEFVLSTPFEEIPRTVINRVQSLILDLIGASLIGVSESSSQAIIRTILAEGSLPQATIFGIGRVTSMGAAALANGAIAHALELDDDHRRGTVHPGAVVIPSALACAEATNLDGKTFLRAVTMGYEITCRAGEAFLGKQYYQGFHPTSTCGVFGAAVAAGIALGLNYKQFVNAMGIAGTLAFGLGEWRSDGSWIKRLHPGRAAQSGILASQLAKEGFTGPASIFEGKDGFLKAFSYKEVFDKNAILRDLGRDYRTRLTAFKPYPGCRFAHAAIDIGIEFSQKEKFKPQEITEGIVRIYKTDILNYSPRPSSIVIAQFSLPYLLATAMVRGSVTLNHLTDKAIHDPEILAVSDKIQVIEDKEFTNSYPERYPTEVKIKLASGDCITYFRDCPSGDPESSDYVKHPQRFATEIETKFRSLLGTYSKSFIDSIIQAVENLRDSKSVEKLTLLLGKNTSQA